MARKKPALRLQKSLMFSSAGLFLLIAGFLSLALFFKFASDLPIFPSRSANLTETPAGNEVLPFPIGVDPRRKQIVERSGVESYLHNSLASNHRRRQGSDWFDQLALRLIQSPAFQQLASPFNRTLVIFSGERKEEIVDNIGDILRWDEKERLTFQSLVSGAAPSLNEGKFFPGNYTVEKDADPEMIAGLINSEFSDQVLMRYPEEVEDLVPISEAIIIASLLEREARDFEDMRYISGVIWNRLFIGMNLQLDATLQYAKGERSDQPWWPQVVPADKYINSAYNTYENEGLPPGPIANPSVDAILAALNPRDTNCLFYFHDDEGGFHCTETYEEHVAALKAIYGQGR